MKKNGFTLIELLAIIILFAMVALITIPNINKYTKDSKKTTFENSVISLINAYQYKVVNEGEIGEVSPCDLDLDKCNIDGTIKMQDGKIYLNVYNQLYCAKGYVNLYTVTEGACS